MVKTIVAVRGKPNSGKTTAIHFAYKELSKEGKSLDFNTRYDAVEVKMVLEIDGIYIGFVSAGDKPERLELSLRFLLKQGCVVIVCATRLDVAGEAIHKTIDTVKRFAAENTFNVEWADKPREQNNHDNTNRKFAQEIIARVRRAIDLAELAEV